MTFESDLLEEYEQLTEQFIGQPFNESVKASMIQAMNLRFPAYDWTIESTKDGIIHLQAWMENKRVGFVGPEYTPMYLEDKDTFETTTLEEENEDLR